MKLMLHHATGLSDSISEQEKRNEKSVTRLDDPVVFYRLLIPIWFAPHSVWFVEAIGFADVRSQIGEATYRLSAVGQTFRLQDQYIVAWLVG